MIKSTILQYFEIYLCDLLLLEWLLLELDCLSLLELECLSLLKCLSLLELLLWDLLELECDLLELL